MKKGTVVLICIVLTTGFLSLVYWGLRYSRGVPVVIEEQERVILEVPFIDRAIDLAGTNSFLDAWSSIQPKEIELMYQVMVLPWGKSLVSPIAVRAFHNNRDIYFYIEWNDQTENRSVETAKFSDAAAILFPMKEESQPPALMMGFLGNANIWQWKASQDREYWLKQGPESKAYADFHYPFEDEELFVVSKEVPKSAANDLMAIRVGTITPKEKQGVEGRGFWRRGTWEVVFKRPLKSIDPEIDAVFIQNKKRLCAFAVWNGENGDRGGRKSISNWVELVIK